LKKAAAKVGAGAGGNGEDGCVSGVALAGIAIMPVIQGSQTAAAAAGSAGMRNQNPPGNAGGSEATMFFLPLPHPGMGSAVEIAAAAAAAAAAAVTGSEAVAAPGPATHAAVRGTSSQLAAPALQLLNRVLLGRGGGGPVTPCICCHAKGMLLTLQQHGWELPAADELQLVDPCVLGWVLDSQRVQDSKEADCYSLIQELAKQDLVSANGQSTGGLVAGKQEGYITGLCYRFEPWICVEVYVVSA
jgi:hypothetical protein